MDWKPIKTKQLPLYKQIISYLESRILNGEYPPGSRLPSERQLANQLKVNRSTVKIAFEELQSTGLITSVIGVGRVVNESVYGNHLKRLPNWDKYVKEGHKTNHPLNQQIYQYIRCSNSIINFAIGELSPDLIPMELLCNINPFDMESHLGYENIQGNLALRESISSYMKEYKSIKSTTSSILITSGAHQALHLIIRCLLKSGDSIAIGDPSYDYSMPIFHSAGINTHLLPVGNEGINPEDITTLYKKHRIKMVFIHPNYQDPTGIVLDLEQKKAIINICTKYGIVIVEEDPYSIMGYTSKSNSALKALDSKGVVLYVSSLSNLIASGLRIGWISGPQAVIDLLTDVKQQIDFGQSVIPQLMATKLLNSNQFNEHINNLIKGLEIKRDLTIKLLKRELGEEILFSVPEGGIHLWCKFSHEINELLLFKESIKNGVVFTPGTTLGSKPNHLRFTYSGVNTNQIENGIRRFVEAYKSAKKLS
ncbi:PLP-dependent aminotransferase family protein [Priestia flexa]|jgi:GntR family transcriptional regulator, regulator for abcA and norABC|uniref:aminotransferase-like domain-containing protein n=1 Tax=Priestia flexa TaxID=86664 RepID=UPI00099D0583|nr:PLP-dependent aminotransferase family protein [Priestia flexa]AQX56139.1 GntR family transcriptional regulator [Priestia flexa]